MQELEYVKSTPLEQRMKSYHGEEWHSPKGRIIRDIVYAIDTGLITMVAFMAGVSVSLPNTAQIVVAGLAHGVSGMLAIFFGAFISTKAQRDFFENQIERERAEIRDNPQKERQEIYEILTDMGFSDEEAQMGVERISANPEVWLKFMAQEEIGLIPGTMDSPLEIGLISASSFVLGVVPPYLPFLLGMPVRTALPTAACAVLLFLFILGVAKTRLTRVHWLKSGLETLGIGAVSCGLGLLLGRVASTLLTHH